MKNLLLAALAVVLLFASTHQPKIFIGNEFQTVAVVNSAENLPLTIKFIHSVQKTPVIEELEFKNGEFVLVRTKYKWFIFDMNRHFKDLELRTGKGTQLTIILDGKTYELYKIFPIGTKILVKII